MGDGPNGFQRRMEGHVQHDRLWGFVRFAALLVLLGMGLGGCSAVGYAKALAPTMFRMERVEANIYVDDTMPEEARKAFIATVAEARVRLTGVYGTVVSTPDILACSTQHCFESFGGGRQRALAFGDRMLLSPRGTTVPMVTHEWSHTELLARLGWFTKWIAGDLPAWFDEGLAVATSDEPLHSEEVWRAVEQRGLPRPALGELVSLTEWNRAVVRYGDAKAAMDDDPEHLMVIYPMAGHEVRQWLARAGRAGLLTLIDGIRNGERFDAAYRLAAG
jgi:hypothetical protein